MQENWYSLFGLKEFSLRNQPFTVRNLCRFTFYWYW